MRRPTGAAFRRLPLFWKLLLPYLTLIVVIGVLGAFFIVRGLAVRADSSINEDLSRRSVAASAAVRDRELYLLESGAFAANVRGMAQAVSRGDGTAVEGLLASVLALKNDLSLAVVTTRDGRGLAEFVEPVRGAVQPSTTGRDWRGNDAVARALGDRSGTKAAGLLELNGKTLLVLASPICASSPECGAVGVALVGVTAEQLISSTVAESPDAGAGGPSSTGVSYYAADGRLLAHAGGPRPDGDPPSDVDRPVRRISGSGDDRLATVYAPLLVQGRPEGTLAVSMTTAPAFGAVQSTALRLALIVLAAMLGIVGIGAALSRTILSEVRPLLGALRAIGGGDLSARAERVGDDEMGQLAAGVNTMAEQLEVSYETLEQRVEERTAEVQQLLRERTQFFAAMSHELRTPVAVILSQSQMLADPSFPKSDRWQADAGRILTGAGEQLLSLVSDILELAKAEAGRLEVDLDDVSVPGVVKELRPTLQGLARAAELRLRVSVPARLPAVRADRLRLREVLLHLVDNAVKYTPAGGTVTVTARVADDALEVAVSDTGVGIPEEAAGRIFEPFFRVRSNRTQRGQPSSGLGLAVSRRLIEAQSGTIAFSSTPGEGSTFVIALPLAGRAEVRPAGGMPAGRSASRTQGVEGAQPRLAATTAS